MKRILYWEDRKKINEICKKNLPIWPLHTDCSWNDFWINIKIIICDNMQRRVSTFWTCLSCLTIIVYWLHFWVDAIAICMKQNVNWRQWRHYSPQIKLKNPSLLTFVKKLNCWPILFSPIYWFLELFFKNQNKNVYFFSTRSYTFLSTKKKKCMTKPAVNPSDTKFKYCWLVCFSYNMRAFSNGLQL